MCPVIWHMLFVTFEIEEKTWQISKDMPEKNQAILKHTYCTLYDAIRFVTVLGDKTP